MSEVEGIGEIVTGAAIAAVVEPAAGGEAAVRDGACLNCDASLSGEYCYSCGQRGHIHRTMMSLVHDLAHGVLHFEGKIWRTLPMLAFKPGELTRRYIDGERARFVSPLALFLFSIFVLAAILGSIPYNNSLIGFRNGLEEGWNSVDQQKSDEKDKLKFLQAETMDAAGPAAQHGIDRQTASVAERQATIRESKVDRLTESSNETGAQSKSTWIKNRLDQSKQNPDMLIYKLKNSAYKFIWVLVPLSLPFMWLLFPSIRRFGMYDHAIFVIYSIASISLLAVLFAVIQIVPGLGAFATAGFLIIAPMHIYRQLRGTYSLGRAAALFRMALLLVVILFVLAVWISFLILVGAA